MGILAQWIRCLRRRATIANWWYIQELIFVILSDWVRNLDLSSSLVVEKSSKLKIGNVDLCRKYASISEISNAWSREQARKPHWFTNRSALHMYEDWKSINNVCLTTLWECDVVIQWHLKRRMFPVISCGNEHCYGSLNECLYRSKSPNLARQTQSFPKTLRV